MIEPVIRLASDADAAAIQDCMMRVFRETMAEKTQTFDSLLWSWQYKAGPPSQVVVADVAGELCGYYHVLFMPVSCGSYRAIAGLVQDVGVLAQYRRRGIFRRMGAFALDLMRRSDVAFAYAFPNERSIQSFVGDHDYRVHLEVPLYISPLDLGAIANERFPQLMQFVPTRLTRWPSQVHELMFLRHERSPGHIVEFRSVDPRMAGLAPRDRDELGVRRDAQFLKWRFLDRPDVDYRIYGAEDRSDLRAYVVTRYAQIKSLSCLLVMDLASEASANGRARLRQLLAECLINAKRDGAVMAVTALSGRLARDLSSLGFVRVPEFATPRRLRMVVKVLSPESTELPLEGTWNLSLADWDVL